MNEQIRGLQARLEAAKVLERENHTMRARMHSLMKELHDQGMVRCGCTAHAG